MKRLVKPTPRPRRQLAARLSTHGQVSLPSTNGPDRAPITRTPGVCGGEPCIAGTRISVWVLVRARELGASDRTLRRMYPILSMRDLRQAWAFAAQNQDEIQQQILENEDF